MCRPFIKKKKSMKDFVEYIRANYRRIYNVVEVNDLPLILVTEVINQSVLRGATRIDVTFDGKVVLIRDNAKPFVYRLDSEVVYHLHGMEGIANDETRRLGRILMRQWGDRPYATVNALCSEFSFITSDGERIQTVVCKDGIVESFKTDKISIWQGNTVIMKAFVESIDADVLGDMLEMMACRIPHVTITYNHNNQ